MLHTYSHRKLKSLPKIRLMKVVNYFYWIFFLLSQLVQYGVDSSPKYEVDDLCLTSWFACYCLLFPRISALTFFQFFSTSPGRCLGPARLLLCRCTYFYKTFCCLPLQSAVEHIFLFEIQNCVFLLE